MVDDRDLRTRNVRRRLKVGIDLGLEDIGCENKALEVVAF